MLYVGISQALGLTVLISFYNVFLRIAVQQWQIEPVPFTCYCLLMAAFVLTLAAGPGKLVKETLKSKLTWIYSFILISTYIVDTYVVFYISASEASFFSRLTIPISLAIAWAFFGRRVQKGDMVGLVMILAGLAWLVTLQPKDVLPMILLTVGLSAFFQTLQYVLAETHKQAGEATKVGTMRDEWRVTGLVTFVTSAVFLGLALAVSIIGNQSGLAGHKLIVPLARFSHGPTVFAALFFGASILPFIRYFKWSASQNLKAENLLLFMAFIPVFTFVFEKLAMMFVSIPDSTHVFAQGRGAALLAIAILMTVGAGYTTFVRLRRMIGNTPTRGVIDAMKMALLKGKSLSIHSSETAIDDYEMIRSTLEFAAGDMEKAATLLKIPATTLQVLLDGKGSLALEQSQSTKLARRYRKNVASRDSLTGLLNRGAFAEYVKEQLRENNKLSLVYIDLDKFKPINDTYGHEAGDAVLITVAQRLRDNLPEDALIARLGGDEFAFALPEKQIKTKTLADLSAILVAPMAIADVDVPLTVGASLGHASAPADGSTYDDLLDKADNNMYTAKHGKGR